MLLNTIEFRGGNENVIETALRGLVDRLAPTHHALGQFIETYAEFVSSRVVTAHISSTVISPAFLKLSKQTYI